MCVCIGAGMTNQNARNYKNGGQIDDDDDDDDYDYDDEWW